MDEHLDVHVGKAVFEDQEGTVKADQGVDPLCLGIEDPDDCVDIVENPGDVKREFEEIKLAGSIIDDK